MSEPEGYAEDGKLVSQPAEFIAKIVYYLHFEDRTEPPSNNEVLEIINFKSGIRNGFVPAMFEIEEIGLA